MGQAFVFGDRNIDCSLRKGGDYVPIAIFAAALSLKWVMNVFAIDKPWVKLVFWLFFGDKAPETVGDGVRVPPMATGRLRKLELQGATSAGRKCLFMLWNLCFLIKHRHRCNYPAIFSLLHSIL